MCAVHGGVFMLNRDVDEFVYDDDGRVAGVIANGEVHEHEALLSSLSTR